MTALGNPMLLSNLQNSPAFVFTVKTNNSGTSSSTQFTLPLVSSGTYNFVIEYGDGAVSHITTFNQAEVTHTYPQAGTYTIKIHGTLTGWRFNNGGDRQKILNISNWGSFKFGTNQNAYFSGCSNLTITATDIPDTSATTDWTNAFNACSALTSIPSINSWNLTAATTLANMFLSCALFNQALSLQTSTALTNLSAFLQGASVFNSSLSFANTSHVTSFSSMLRLSAFNQNLTLDTTAATTFGNMFRDNVVFNSTLTCSSTDNLTVISSMFQNALAFNKTLSTIFGNTDLLNSAISTWAGATSFNQPIVMNVPNLISINSILSGATSFNSVFTLTNSESLFSMNSSFLNASAFDQDLSGLNVTSLGTATNMLVGSGITTANYNKILDINTGWASQVVQVGVALDAGTVQYSGADAIAGRALLTGTDSWTINDGGLAP